MRILSPGTYGLITWVVLLCFMFLVEPTAPAAGRRPVDRHPALAHSDQGDAI